MKHRGSLWPGWSYINQHLIQSLMSSEIAPQSCAPLQPHGPSWTHWAVPTSEPSHLLFLPRDTWFFPHSIQIFVQRSSLQRDLCCHPIENNSSHYSLFSALLCFPYHLLITWHYYISCPLECEIHEAEVSFCSLCISSARYIQSAQ